MITPRSLHVPALAALAALLAVLAGERSSAADDTAATCVSAYKGAQRLRKVGKLTAAREQLIVCSQRGCPSALTGDCSQWLAEVDAALPSIVVEARDEAGRDVSPVRVLIDGAEITGVPDGAAIPVDPGAHKLRFEHEGLAVEHDVVVREGERRRKIPVVFLPPAPPPLPPAHAPLIALLPSASSAPPVAVPVPPPRARSIAAPPAAFYALAGVSLASFAVSAGLGVAARGEYEGLHTGCEPRCDPDVVEPTRRKAIAANVLLGTGVAVASAAVLVWVLHPRRGAGARAGRGGPALITEF